MLKSANRLDTALMNSTLIQMTLIMACGVVWQFLKPAGQTAVQTRLVLTTLVYHLLLPAMVLDVLWVANIGIISFHYMILGVSCILLAMLCAWSIGRLFNFKDKRLGAIILAVIPNVTYLG